LPFRTVLAPKTNTVLATAMAVMLQVQLYQAGTEIRTPLLHRLVCKPLVRLEGLGGRVEWAPAEAVILGHAVGGRLEHVMGRQNLENPLH